MQYARSRIGALPRCRQMDPRGAIERLEVVKGESYSPTKNSDTLCLYKPATCLRSFSGSIWGAPRQQRQDLCPGVLFGAPPETPSNILKHSQTYTNYLINLMKTTINTRATTSSCSHHHVHHFWFQIPHVSLLKMVRFCMILRHWHMLFNFMCYATDVFVQDFMQNSGRIIRTSLQERYDFGPSQTIVRGRMLVNVDDIGTCFQGFCIVHQMCLFRMLFQENPWLRHADAV